MKVSKAVQIWLDYHASHLKKKYTHVVQVYCRPILPRIEHEIVFILQKVADRLRSYANEKCKQPDDRIFPITYEAARMMVIKSGSVVGIHLRPHDLRRHSATYASRSGVPIEIVSKIILRHSNLSTTQKYLGTISDVEAMRWIENIYG